MKNFLNHAKRAATLLANRPKGWQSLLYNTAMAKARRVGPLMMPVHVTIEPTNACNLRCPVCETGNGSMNRPTGRFDFEQYRAFIDQLAPTTAVLMFYFMGEPFLNKHAYDMIRYARDKGIYVETCTNGELVNPVGVVYSDVNDISFQIGGMTQETHERYRVGGDLSRVIRNLEQLLVVRQRHLHSNVQVNVGFVVMKHNEHEVPEFLNWAKKIGVDRANLIDPCVRTIAEGKELLPDNRRYWFYDEESFARGVLKPKIVPKNECTWIWNSMLVCWDGSVVPCCRDPQGRHILGNVFETSSLEIWNGEAMRDFRRRIVTEQGKVDVCRLCSGYGVPALERSRPISFEMQRVSLVDTMDKADWS